MLEISTMRFLCVRLCWSRRDVKWRPVCAFNCVQVESITAGMAEIDEQLDGMRRMAGDEVAQRRFDRLASHLCATSLVKEDQLSREICSKTTKRPVNVRVLAEMMAGMIYKTRKRKRIYLLFLAVFISFIVHLLIAWWLEVRFYSFPLYCTRRLSWFPLW